MVQLNTFCPTPRPLIVVVGEFAAVMVPLPLTNAHVPVEGARGVLPAIVVEGVVLQMLWSAPALAAGAPGLNTVIVTWSVVMPFAQGPLFTVHWNTFAPTLRPLTAVNGEVAFANVPVPLTRVHAPVAGAVGALAVITDVVVQTC